MMDGSFYTKVVGVTFKNDDGSDRQRIIRNLSRDGELEERTELFFVPQPTNPYDSNCILVNSGNGQTLGTLSRDVAAQVSPQIRQGYMFKAYVSAQTGGDIGYAYGINIKVERYKPEPAGSVRTGRSTSSVYPYVVTLKRMFADFFPEFQESVVRDEASWRYEYGGRVPWADEALKFKRQGEYVESCQLYFRNVLSRGDITLGWAQGIFKTLACSGDIADALAFGREWFNYADLNAAEPDTLLMHFSTLLRFVQNPETDTTMLPQYLQSISGNPNYSIDVKKTDLYTDEVLQKIRSNA